MTGTLALTTATANAGFNNPSCSNFATDITNNYAGSMDPFLDVTLSSGDDMVGGAVTNNGHYTNFCTPVNGWTAEVTLIGYRWDGSQWVGCPNTYKHSSSTSGQAINHISCDGAQYYEMVSSHRVWFAGTPIDSSLQCLYEHW